MKILITLLLCLVPWMATCQDLTSKIIDQPDGLTIGYFNTATDSCLPKLFIGNNQQVLFPCYSNRDYTRIDIFKATDEIKELRKILTKELILSLNHCCMDKDCPDTIHGYHLMIKKGQEYHYQYLDVGHLPTNYCGSTALNRIIELLHKINRDYQ